MGQRGGHQEGGEGVEGREAGRDAELTAASLTSHTRLASQVGVELMDISLNLNKDNQLK